MKSKRIVIIIILLLILIIIIIGFLILNPIFTGKALVSYSVNEEEANEEYTHTKAICNDSNFCQDYEIKCKNNETVSITPITGAVVQHEEDWIDPRNDTELCE